MDYLCLTMNETTVLLDSQAREQKQSLEAKGRWAGSAHAVPCHSMPLKRVGSTQTPRFVPLWCWTCKYFNEREEDSTEGVTNVSEERHGV